MLGVLRRYHAHDVLGLENIPKSGPALLAVHHSLATYDAFLFGHAVIRETGRTFTGLGDDKLFAVPGVRRFASASGILPASPENGRKLLNEGHLLGVAPGGMREALRPSSERKHVLWDKRKGFVRLAIQTGAPIIPVACPSADFLYTVYENRLTKLAYKKLKLPVPVARGFGLTLVPRPVRLTTYVGEAIVIPDGAIDDPETVDTVHAQVTAAIEALLDRRDTRDS
ncbi:MAG: 1-acyl-sn-glycerol-3-phosphate acyltransferase [Myxococcota bacterium]